MREERIAPLRRFSRRGFIQASALAATAIPGLRARGATGNLANGAESRSAAASSGTTVYLDAAKETAQWIRAAGKNTGRGTYWLPDPDHPEKATTVSPVSAIYSGSAGIVLFFLELAKATGNDSYLNDAKSGADYLANTWEESFGRDAGLFKGLELGFASGLAGTAFVLGEAWKATQEARYKDAAVAVTDYIAAAAKPAGRGVEWVNAPGVVGDGGILLYLLYAAHTFRDNSYLLLAAKAGDHTLELSQPDPRGGLRWQGIAPERFGQSKDFYWPNFELGTAGVSYVLARLYEETRQTRFLYAAVEGAKHVETIATVRGDSALVHYREPDLKDLYYLGYCHGPAGTARTFYQLYKATHDRRYLVWTERLARGVINSGIPEKQTPGFWNVVCQCCGSAGVVDLFLGLWVATKRPEYLAFSRRVADQLLSRETDLDGKGYRWYQAWTRVKPWEVNAETGYMIGAAGVGSALLHLHLADRNRYEAILFPDNPFPRALAV